MLLEWERRQAVAYSKKLLQRGLTRGTGGNISLCNREAGLWAVTPSGVEYDTMQPEDIVVLDLVGRIVDGAAKPSSETEMHHRCYLARPDVNAIVHTHSRFATVLACMEREILPVHYLIGYAGRRVPCIPYHTFGSTALAEAAAEAFREHSAQHAILLGHHGLLAVGRDIDYAFDTAEETEFVAELYYRMLLAGEVRPLTDTDMQTVAAQFAGYGQKHKSTVPEGER